MTVPNCTSYVVSKLEPGTWEVQGECLRDQPQQKPGRFSDLHWGMTPFHVTPVLGLGLPVGRTGLLGLGLDQRGCPHADPPPAGMPSMDYAVTQACGRATTSRGLQVTRGNCPLTLRNPRQCFLDWTLRSRSQTPLRAVSFDF